MGLAPGSASDARYRVEAARLEPIGRLAGLPLGGAAIVEGTLSGPREALVASGTLEGSDVTYAGNGALDLDSRYRVTLPDLGAGALRVEAETEATFVKVGPVEVQEVAARTVYGGGELVFEDLAAKHGLPSPAPYQMVWREFDNETGQAGPTLATGPHVPSGAGPYFMAEIGSASRPGQKVFVWLRGAQVVGIERTW